MARKRSYSRLRCRWSLLNPATNILLRLFKTRQCSFQLRKNSWLISLIRTNNQGKINSKQLFCINRSRSRSKISRSKYKLKCVNLSPKSKHWSKWSSRLLVMNQRNLQKFMCLRAFTRCRMVNLQRASTCRKRQQKYTWTRMVNSPKRTWFVCTSNQWWPWAQST